MAEGFTVKSRMHDYQVRFGDFTAAFAGKDKDGVFLIADRAVLDMVQDRLSGLVDESRVMAVEAVEDSKTLRKSEEAVEWLIEHGFRKNYTLIALGGGVVQDLTAFVGTVLYRGVKWAFIPTTLLAQADSCIGSKSSINFGLYKNLLGSFYPPVEITIDTAFLKTLPPDEIRSGIGEILHYYLVDGRLDPARSLMERYDSWADNPEAITGHIHESLKIKKAMIEIDELDRNERNVFNYGHTFGHAIEAVTQYRINHGQAVTMGMDIANHLSVRMGYLKEEERRELHAILEKNLPDFRMKDEDFNGYLKALSKDKKNVGHNLGCILTRGAGNMFKTQVPFDEKLKEGLLAYFKTGRSAVKEGAGAWK